MTLSSVFGIIIAGLLAIAAIYGFILYKRIRRDIRHFSREVFGTDSLSEGFKNQELEYRKTPKSLSATTSLCLPRIKDDFPEFTYEDFKRRAEQDVVAYLKALDSKQIPKAADWSSIFRNQIMEDFERQQENQVTESYRDIRIHKSEISEYRKSPGHMDILLQTAVQYRYAVQKEGEPIREPILTQERFTSVWSFIQDAEAFGSLTNVSVSCPNCGAPIRNLGRHTCEYCGTEVTPINLRAWCLIRITRG